MVVGQWQEVPRDQKMEKKKKTVGNRQNEVLRTSLSLTSISLHGRKACRDLASIVTHGSRDLAPCHFIARQDYPSAIQPSPT